MNREHCFVFQFVFLQVTDVPLYRRRMATVHEYHSRCMRKGCYNDKPFNNYAICVETGTAFDGKVKKWTQPQPQPQPQPRPFP